MTRLVVALAAALAVAAPAHAKGPMHASVCGVSRCKQVLDAREASQLVRGGYYAAAAAPAPYYVIRLTAKEPGDGPYRSWKIFFVPGEDLFASLDEQRLVHWYHAFSADDLRELLTDVEPFPAPSVREARVAGRRVEGDPGTYLGLFAVARSTPVAAQHDWVPVDLVTGVATPWTASDRDLMFSPAGQAIELPGKRVAVGAEVAADIRAGRTLETGGDGFAWLTLVVAFGGVALAIALAVLAQRLARGPAHRPSPA